MTLLELVRAMSARLEAAGVAFGHGTTNAQILKTLDSLRAKHPDVECEIVDPYTFFALFKEHYSRSNAGTAR